MSLVCVGCFFEEGPSASEVKRAFGVFGDLGFKTRGGVFFVCSRDGGVWHCKGSSASPAEASRESITSPVGCITYDALPGEHVARAATTALGLGAAMGAMVVALPFNGGVGEVAGGAVCEELSARLAQNSLDDMKRSREERLLLPERVARREEAELSMSAGRAGGAGRRVGRSSL